MKVSRSVEASGSAVANCVSAKFRGVEEESAKLMSENFTPPEMVSGTLPIVVVDVSQVTTFWIAITVSSTSAGRAVDPTTKQAVARPEIGETLAPGLTAGYENGVNGIARTLLKSIKLVRK